ncbi:hypothetical protein BH23BAC2_BH23BAC2_08000 [soil metagenome]
MKTKAKIIQSFKTWVVIYPSITVFYILFGEYLENIPLYQRTLILTLILVPWMVFVGYPLIHLILKLNFKNDKP